MRTLLALFVAVTSSAKASDLDVWIKSPNAPKISRIVAAERLAAKNLKVDLEGAESGQTALATSCTDLLALTSQGYYARLLKTASDRPTHAELVKGEEDFAALEASCRDLEFLAHLDVPKRSNVRDLLLQKDLVPAMPLPAIVIQGESSFQACVEKAGRNGTTIGSFMLNFNKIFILKGEQKCELKAFGDWNGDALDDAVVECWSLLTNHDSVTSMIVVTRKDNEGSLRIVELRRSGHNQFWLGEGEKVVPEAASLSADMSCSGDEIDAARVSSLGDFKQARTETAYAKLKDIFLKCDGKAADTQLIWLLSDMALLAGKLKDPSKCKEMVVIAADRGDFAYGQDRALNALKYNLKHCTKW